ncbi:Nuclear speckle splicing regulatory protein 1 N-terminal domain-containing protein [Madurella fahalii]|uniref:Nuclear speckle splicing regulatory protein 1 N-terminal domain-containing protein n=1 Tax=Madurella fahalii TaxID=1157608 RepID=A0ABQ0GS54_9PEZI
MSKPAFSFGLKKSGPSKPAPARGKPTPFSSGGDDDGSGDEAASNINNNNNNNNNTVQIISELDGFASATSAPSPDDSRDRKKKKPSTQPLPPQQPPQSKKATQFADLSSALTSRKYAASAEQSDPSIYDYDAAYDSFKAAKANSSSKSADAADKQRPRYFDALQKAADVRERDRQIAEERRLQRERAAEGDAFADKEKFVTEAYRRQQEANRRLEEEEKRREEAERKKNKGRGLADFYRGMLERGEEEHAALVKAAEERKVVAAAQSQDGEVDGEEGGREKSAAERAREINAMGGNVLVNEDGEVVDKRQLLKGGLNVAAKKKAEVQMERERQAAAAAAAASKAGSGHQSKGVYAAGGKQAMRERQTRMLEAQLEETLKRSRQEEEEEMAKVQLASKSRKTEAEISSAKERYLARKRAAEEAKKKGLDEGP